MPLVSILIPVFNREKMVGQAISSALNQSFSDFEVIVVDNASTDGTYDVCLEFSQRDERVKVYRNSENIGPVGNWKRCAALANGLFSKILWSDDLMMPSFLERTVPLMANDVGFVYTATKIAREPDQDVSPAYIFGETGIYDAKNFISGVFFDLNFPVSPGCAVFHTEDMRAALDLQIEVPNIRDFSRHGAGPDLLIYLFSAKKRGKFAYVNEVLSFFREHEDSISISMNKSILLDRYRQAKLWYCTKFEDESALALLFMHIWIRRTWLSKKYDGFYDVANYFGIKSINFSFLVFFRVFGRLMLTKSNKLLRIS